VSKKLKRLLIVEDEEDLLWGVAELLNEKDDLFEIEIARNGEEANDLLAKKSFDLVITDIRMPKMDGLKLLDEIKKGYRDTKVIVMTAYGSNLKELAKAKGAVHFINKPFSFPEFRDLVIQTLKEEPGQL